MALLMRLRPIELFPFVIMSLILPSEQHFGVNAVLSPPSFFATRNPTLSNLITFERSRKIVQCVDDDDLGTQERSIINLLMQSFSGHTSTVNVVCVISLIFVIFYMIVSTSVTNAKWQISLITTSHLFSRTNLDNTWDLLLPWNLLLPRIYRIKLRCHWMAFLQLLENCLQNHP